MENIIKQVMHHDTFENYKKLVTYEYRKKGEQAITVSDLIKILQDIPEEFNDAKVQMPNISGDNDMSMVFLTDAAIKPRPDEFDFDEHIYTIKLCRL